MMWKPVPPDTSCGYCHLLMAPYQTDRMKVQVGEIEIWFHKTCHLSALLELARKQAGRPPVLTIR
jgi:hypothetical protein